MPPSPRARRLACLLPLVLASCSSSNGGDAPPPAPTWPQPKVDLRADNNRNGTVDLDDPTEDEGEDRWDNKHGAIFLANIDDDLRACPARDASGRAVSDVDLPKCNDAANEIVDGDDDLLDLARLKTAPWAEVPATATAAITVSEKAAPFVRLFKNTVDGFVALDLANAALTVEEIAAGVELAIEAKDIVRDPAVWDGFVDVTLRVSFAGEPEGRPAFDESDTVRLRVAPVLLQHHGSPAESVFVTRVPDSGSAEFRADLGRAVDAAKVPGGLQVLDVPESDPWTQDFFETGFMSMPTKDGQHVIRVALRSANIYGRRTSNNPLRAAGKIVFTKLRGKDVAGLSEFDLKSNPDMDSLNSFGNTETIPPFEHGGKSWPLGRIVRGSSASYYPDKSFTRMLNAQGVQDPIAIDTSWLLVSHIDETISFVAAPKPGPRSFLLLANDARLAKTLLEEAKTAGHGDTKLFVGKSWVDYEAGTEIPAERSINDVLADADVMAASQRAAAEVDAQVEVLVTETGVTEDEIVKVPFLHWDVYGGSVAYQPGTVNALVIDATHIAAPVPHGPTIDGKDPFRTSLETALSKHGVQVAWVEDWDGYHRNLGEVHCGSNVFRAIPTAKWWEAAR